MLNKLKELRALNAFARKQSVGMQRKLMLYWVSMILVVFAAVILLLSVAGAFSRSDAQLHEVMELHLKNTQDNLAGHLDRLTAQSLNLSKELSREIEGVLIQEGVSLQEVNDDPKRLLKLQEAMYPLIRTTLQAASPLPWCIFAASRISPGKRIWSCTIDGTWNLTPTRSRAAGS